MIGRMTIAAPEAGPAAGWLTGAERLLLALIAMITLCAVLLGGLPGRSVDWLAFAPSIGGAVGLVALGAYARMLGHVRLGLSAVSLGLFMSFSAVAAIAIFALFPHANPLIDRQLMQIDAMMGYDWQGFVTGMAEWPLLSLLLRWTYKSALLLLVVVMLTLAITRRDGALYRMLLTGMTSLAAATLIWWAIPSIGPSAYVELPAEVIEATRLVTTPAYGLLLLDHAVNGIAAITPAIISGSIAFPSYHIIMALLAAAYARGTWFFIPSLIGGLGMIPATLGHGGHHLADLIGGTVVFLLCAALSRRILPDRRPG